MAQDDQAVEGICAKQMCENIIHLCKFSKMGKCAIFLDQGGDLCKNFEKQSNNDVWIKYEIYKTNSQTNQCNDEQL